MRTEQWFANGINGRHVLFGLIVFFGVMLFANSLLVYYALDTFSGGDRPDPYRSGLNYNETIAEAERQDALGWETDVAYEVVRGRLTLRFRDQTEAPVAGLKLGGTVIRPASDRDDKAVSFREIGQGVYVADIDLAPGNWVIALESQALKPGDPIYRLKRRLYVGDRS